MYSPDDGSCRLRKTISRWQTGADILFFLIICLVAFPARGADADSIARQKQLEVEARIAAELTAALPSFSTAADSIVPMFNIYDLTRGKEKTARGIELYRTAKRAGKNDIALEALLNVANYNQRNDSILKILLQYAKAMPESDARSQAVAFIEIQRNAAAARSVSSETRGTKLQELIRQAASTSPGDIYDRIVRLHAICIYLSEISEGDLLADYLHRLGALIEQLPGENHALRNAYYVWASLIFTKVGQQELAVASCRNLLKEIDALDERNRRIGRVYRSYDDNRYIVYTRLLENYDVLDPSDIDEYYNEAMRIARQSPRAAQTYATAPLPSIYYAFYQKKYRKAFDLIRQCKDEPYLDRRRLQIMKMYIGAATAIGEQDALLEAYPAYTRMLEDYLDSRQKERYRELQVMYDLNDIRTENLRLMEEQQHSRKRMWRAITIVCIVLLAGLGTFVFILLKVNRKKANLATELKKANETLTKESDQLRQTRDELKTARDKAHKADALKTDFINNMSHEVKVPLQAMQEYSQMIVENVDDDRKKFLTTFADRLLLNCEMVSTLINDVLQLAELHNASLKIREMPHELMPICETALDAVRKRLHPGVSLKLEAAEPGLTLYTDRHRLLQILTNLLSNAVKFTVKGTITLHFGKTDDGRQMLFTVTDTGIGVDPENHEMIFERFSKVDSTIPGAGLGLTISRMLAQLMGGHLTIDPAYTRGARFILVLPVKS